MARGLRHAHARRLRRERGGARRGSGRRTQARLRPHALHRRLQPQDDAQDGIRVLLRRLQATVPGDVRAERGGFHILRATGQRRARGALRIRRPG